MIVDAHSHLYPRSYIELLKGRSSVPRIVGAPGSERFLIFQSEEEPGGIGGRAVDEEFWDVGAKLAFMDRFGIDRSVVSLGNPWLDPFEGPQARRAAATVNEELAALEFATGGRIVALGVVPQHDVAEAAAVVREIAEAPSLHGVANGSRLCGRMLDDPDLEPVWEALAATGIPFVVHPHYSLPAEELSGYGMTPSVALGFPFETTASVARLVLGGVVHRHPGLRVVASHGGGTLPFLAARLDVLWRTDPPGRVRCPVPPSELISRIGLDALVYAEGPLQLVVQTVGAGNAMFGTDHPFAVADPAANLAAIDAALDGTERRSVLSWAAEAWFGLPPTG